MKKNSTRTQNPRGRKTVQRPWPSVHCGGGEAQMGRDPSCESSSQDQRGGAKADGCRG
jgi:hypothetical protein